MSSRKRVREDEETAEEAAWRLEQQTVEQQKRGWWMSDRKRKLEETEAAAAQRLERETMAATSRMSDLQKRSLFHALAVANPDVSVPRIDWLTTDTPSKLVSIKDVMATLNRDLRRMALANYTAQDEQKHGVAIFHPPMASAAPMFADFDRPVPGQEKLARPNTWMHSQVHNAGVVTERVLNGGRFHRPIGYPWIYHKGFGPPTTAFSHSAQRVLPPQQLSRNPKFLEAPYAESAEMSPFKSLIPKAALRGGTASDDEATLRHSRRVDSDSDSLTETERVK